LHLTQPLSCSTTPCRLSVTAYSIHGYPPYWSPLLLLQPEPMPSCGVRFSVILAILHTMMDLL
jgi:hypothetical protein